ncbi:MAG: hypothetical protein IH595_07260 [Bacteroidales bacterium]|nr:hypothetical protein [Bacteroidales bacterium]
MIINKNVVIAGLARDCEKSLPGNILLVEKLRSNFKWSQVVIVENDSKDNTKRILGDWSREKPGVKVISQDFGTITIPIKSKMYSNPSASIYRIEKMVKYRNIYIDYINSISEVIDYLIVIDLDIQSFSVQGVISSILNVNKDWGGIFANGITRKGLWGMIFSKIYFDIYAIYEYPLRSRFGFTKETLHYTQKTINKKIRKSGYYNVISAFGGLGIYKYEAVKNIKYSLLTNCENDNDAVCEHIPFNLGIINSGYKNYISKDLEVIYGPHSFGTILAMLLSLKTFDFIYRIYCKIRSKKN